MRREHVPVIVVDDNQDVREILGDWLSLDGYAVRLAATAREALALAEAEVPVCVLLDLGLPDIDGAELAKVLRHRHGPDLVLIAVTGRSEEEAQAAAENVGIDLVLTKPIGIEALRRLLPPLV
jgi:DNA-binding response OmpR family regulator